MYDIVTLEPEDKVVQMAVNTIVQNTAGVIPGPAGNYRYTAQRETHTSGDGGADQQVLVLVGHGSVNGLSGCKTWKRYVETVAVNLDYASKRTIYIVACKSAAEDGQALVVGNFANDVKGALPEATVWASSTNVSAKTLTGDWKKF